jgi:predicted MFS family arabinose efflux permease
MTEAVSVRAGWLPVAPLGAGTFAIGTDLFVVAGVLPGLAADLGATAGEAGLTVTAFSLASAIGAPVLGALLGARPPRQVLIASLAVFALCNVGSALAPGLAVLLVMRVLGALAASAYVPAAGAAAVAAAPAARRGRALGVVLAGTALGMVLGAPLGVLVAALHSWRAAFWLVALLATAAVLGLVRSGAGTGEPSRSTLAERLAPVRSPAVAGTLGVTFLVMAASNSTYTYLGVVVADPAALGLLIAVFGLGGIAGTWWGGSAVDRHGSGPVVVVAVVTLAVSVAALPRVGTAVAVAVVAAWGVAVWGFAAAQQHRVAGLGPASLLLALNSCAVHLGFATGALLGGRLVDATGVGSLWVFPVVCCGAGLVLLGILRQEVRS